ncbi:MopE-related protein [Runella sp. SP2]|uniref:MopE-related protein n=1 Tax=Runella sp. SP2 TaxID=2268026 RepID=UPI0013DD9281|nr:MopE-related protein [Runella sp. SP2]
MKKLSILLLCWTIVQQAFTKTSRTLAPSVGISVVTDIPNSGDSDKITTSDFTRSIAMSGANTGGLAPLSIYSGSAIIDASPALAVTRYVRPGGNDSNTGTSWAQAYQTLQKAIEVAVAGDQIWLASGTYYPTKDNAGTIPGNGQLKTFFINKDIAIYGGFNGTESSLSQRNWRTNIAILSGDVGTVGDDADNAYHVVYIQGVSAAMRLDGVAVTKGNANGGDANDFSNPAVSGIGGGVFVYATGGITSAPTINNCRLYDNQASGGGGAGAASKVSGSSTPIFTNCLFENNIASRHGGAVLSMADGDFSGTPFSTPVFEHCTFYNNNASLSKKVGYSNALQGGGSTASFIKCILWGDPTGDCLGTASFSAIRLENSLSKGGCTFGLTCVGTVLNTDPLFVNAAGGDLRLAVNSPAIDGPGGEYFTSAPAEKDYNNNNRPIGCYDYGAFETATSTATVVTCYQDMDGDGYGIAGVTKQFCTSCGEGWADNALDCDDNQNADLPYSLNQSGTFSPVAGTGTSVTLGDDAVSSTLPIGFTFSFFGNSYTDFAISSNGFITFSPFSSGCCSGQSIPNTSSPNNLIALAWDDLDPSASGSINYFTTGSAPNRKLIVNYVGIPIAGSSSPNVTSQIILYETSNLIEIHSTNINGVDPATMGIENASGTIALAVPGRNRAAWSATNDYVAFVPITTGQFITTFYRDIDGDGFGNPAVTQQACAQPSGYVTNNTDCNDNNALEKPGQVWYKDTDNDNYVETGAATITQCLRPAGYKLATELQATSGDCNDNNAAIKPGATEICDGIDNNCDGFTDDGCNPDYTITTTGGGIIITDAVGNGETLNVSQNSTNIRFDVTGRTYSLNGGTTLSFPADVALAGASSITVNTAVGNDIINVGAFTANLPSLSINGGTGDDQVNFNGDITFATNANLDVDLQNDDANPGTDQVSFTNSANLLLTGTGAAVIKVSRNIVFSNGTASLETTDGNLTLEANQQATASTGNFVGVAVNGAIIRVNGTGTLTVKGKSGDDSAINQFGVVVQNGGLISGGTSGTATIEGAVGAASTNGNIGVNVTGTNARITSLGGNVSVVGFGGSTGASSTCRGVAVTSNGTITAGGSGTVTVSGTGGAGSGNFNVGVYVAGTANTLITSSGGNVSVTGNGGGTGSGANNYGIWQELGGAITAGGNGLVTVQGTGGATTGNNNYGIYVDGANTQITSGGGNVSVTGQGGGASSSQSNIGVFVQSAAKITAGGTGTVNVNGTGGQTSGGRNRGVCLSNNNAQITSSGGDVSVTGQGGGTTAGEGNIGVYLTSNSLVSAGGTGDLTVNGTGAATSGNGNYGVYLISSAVNTNNGNLNIVAQGGGSGSSIANYGLAIVSGTQVVAGGSGYVNIQASGGSGTTGSSNHGANVEGAGTLISSSGGNVTINAVGGGAGPGGNNQGLFAGFGSQISAGGSGTVSITGQGGTGTGGSSNWGIKIQDTDTQITSSGGNVILTGIEGSGSNSIGISYTSSAAITTATNGGNITLIANSMDLASTISTRAAGSTALRPYTNNIAINLGTATNSVGSPLGLSDTELDNITTGTLIIGNANSGNLTVSAEITRPASTNVQLISGGDINVSGGGFNTGGGTLLLDPGSALAAIKPTFNGTDVTASTLSLGGDLNIAINGTTAGDGTGSTYSQLKAVGVVNLAGVNLVLSGTPALVGGETFVIVDNDGTEAVGGTFSNFAQGATLSNFLNSGLNATISYTGGGDNNDVVITVEQVCPTTANAGPDQTPACGTTQVTLAGNAPTVGTGVWSVVSGTGGTFGNASSSTSTFSGTAGSTYTLRWTITNGSCTSSDDVTISFNQNPTVSNAGPDQTPACGTTQVTLAANAPTVGTGLWSVVSGTGGTFGDASSPTSTFSGTAGSVYTLRWTTTNGSCTSSDDVTISFNQNPTVSNAGPDQTPACGTTQVTLAGNAPMVGTGLWSVVSGTGGTFGDASSPTSTFSGTAGSTYTLRWTITNGSCTSSDDVTISFNQNPTVSNAGPDQTPACGTTQVTLAGNAPMVGTGLWSVVSGTGGTFGDASSPTSTFSGTAGSVYTLRWTTTNGSCTSSDDVTISFNQNPTVSNAGPDQTPACGTTQVTLAGNAPMVGNGLWSVVSGTGGTFGNASSPTSTFNGTAGSTYTLRWTITNGSCTSSDDVTISFNQNPTVSNAGPDQTPACGTTQVTLAGNAPMVGTGLWSVVSGTGGTFGDASSPTSTFSGTAGSVYTLRWTTTNGSCTSSDDVTITFNQNPTVSNAGPDQTPACGTTQVTLAGNAPMVGNGLWSVVSGTGGTFGNASSPTSTFNGTAGSVYTLRWTTTNGSCTSSDDVTITFNQNPTVSNAGPDQTPACGTTQVTLAGNAPTVGTGIWTVVSGTGGTFGDASSPTSTFSGTAGSTYTLRWTITNGSCTSSDDVTISFNQNPTVSNAGPDQTPACGTTQVTLAGNAPTVGTGLWSVVSGMGGTFGDASSPTSTFSGTAGSVYTLRWTTTNGSCTSSDDVTISFNQNPTVSNAGSDQTPACGTTQVTLAGNAPMVGTGLWSVVSGTGGTFGNASSPTSTFSGTAGSTYTLRWTTTNGSCTSSDDVTISFNQNPTVSNAGPDQTPACGTTQVTLAGNAPMVGTGLWSVVSGTGGTFGNASSPTSTFNGTAGSSYTLRWTITNGSCTSSDDVTISFNQNPTVSNAGPDQTPACGTTQVTLAANAPTVGTGLWSVVSGTGGTFGNASSPTSTFSGTAGSIYTLRWTITNGSCTSSDDVTISFNQNPTVSNAGPDQTPACGTTQVTLAGNAPMVGTGLWSVVSGTGGTFGNASSPTSTFSGTAGSTYTLRWTTTNGSCTSSDDVTISFNQNPTVSNAGLDQTPACGTTQVTLAGNAPTVGTGIWTVVSGTGGTFGDASSPTSTFSGTAGSTYTLRWTITNGSCTSSDDVTITFNQNPTVSNAGPDQTPACGTAQVTLAGNAPTVGTGLWSVVSGTGGTFGNASSPTSTFSGTAGSTYTLRWTITNGSCTSSDDVTISFNQNPTVSNAGPDQTPACGTTQVTLAGNTPMVGTGIWSVVSGTGGTFGDASSPTSTFSGTAGSTYTLRWTITNGSCTSSDDVTITFNQNPTVSNAGPDQTPACGTTQVTLAGNTPMVGTGIWSVVSGTGGTFGDASSPTSTFSGTAGSTYTLRWTITNGSCTSSDDVTITFNQNPTVSNAGPDQTPACGTTQVTLAGNAPMVGTGLWSVVSGTGGTFGDASSPTSTFNGTAGSVYTLRWTITNGSCTSSDDVTISFNQNPTVSNAGPDQTPACGTTQVTLAGNAPMVGTGLWTVVSGTGGTFGDANSATSTFTGVAGNSYVLRWTISNGQCTASTDDVSVTFTQNPTPPTIGTITQPTCALATGSVALSGLPSSGTWTLTRNPGAVTSTGTGATTTVSGLSSGTYTFTVTNDVGCTSGVSGDVDIIAPPSNVSITTAASAAICAGATSFTIPYTATTGSPTSYSITGAGITTVTNGALTSTSIVVNLSVPATGSSITYSLVVSNASGCVSPNVTGSVAVQNKPTITLSTLQQTLNEGNNPVLCDTDANPVNGLQFTVSGLCVVGNPVWRVQVGSGAWSDWSATAPISQPSNNQPHRYQAACDANCASTYSGVIELTINNRASVPQNVSLLVDGVTVAVGETKEVCSLVTTTLTFNANCAAGEVILYSVDGGEYSAGVPVGLVDNQFHNYRVRCRKSDGTPSCVESESGVMRLKLVVIPSAPTVSLSSTSSCNPSASFSGQSTCGSLRTVWYNATTNVALPSLPSTVPSQTTSYYARCQTENGCVSEKSNVVTFTLTPTQVAPVITASQEIVCTGTTVTVSANCPAGSQTFWNTGVTAPSFEVAFNNVTKQTYWAKCLFEGGCQSAESMKKDIYWNAFVVTLINIGESKSAVKPANDKSLWTSQFITRDGGPELEQSTQVNPTLYYVENANKLAPRYWTVNVEACGLSTDGSLTFDMLATPEMGVIRSFNTHENNAPYFMYANREGWTELYGQNHPAYGFYQDNGVGGNVYDTGLPKGLYKLSIRYWDQKGWGSIYPSTRRPQGNVLAYQEYWFRIQSKDGVGVGAARTADSEVARGEGQGSDNGKQITDNGVFATVMPNPVTNILRLKVQDSKGQVVQTSLTDASGREVLRRQFLPETNTHQEEFGVGELPSGVYFLRVQTENKQEVLKVLKVN